MPSGVQQAHYECQHGELFELEDYEFQLVAAMLASERKEQTEAKAKEKVTAIYKLNLHCNECARAIEKPIIRTQGVENVYIDVESGKVTVRGRFDAMKMLEVIKKKSRRKVEWISLKPEDDKGVRKEERIEKMQKEEVVKTTVIKLHLHCEKCENDLENTLLKLKGVHSVKIDRGEQICTVVGIVEEDKLIEYIHKKAGKRGEIVQQKQMNKAEATKEDESEKKELKNKDVAVPYFIHCTHAPQWFSDENPNSCSVM